MPKSPSYLQFQIEQKDEYIKMLESQLFTLKEAYVELEERNAKADTSSDAASNVVDTPVKQFFDQHCIVPQAVRNTVIELPGRLGNLLNGIDGAALWVELWPQFVDLWREVNALAEACKRHQESTHSKTAGEHQTALESLYEAQIYRLKEDHENEKAQIRKDHEAEYQAGIVEHKNDIEKKLAAYRELEDLKAEMESQVQILKRELVSRDDSQASAHKDVKFIGETLQLMLLKLTEHRYISGWLALDFLKALQTPPLESSFSSLDEGDGTPYKDQPNSSNVDGEA